MASTLSRRSFVATGVAALAAPYVVRAQTLTKVRYTMDWAFQGPSSFMLLGREKGFFREAGIDLVLSRGFGSGRVPVDIAAGTYDMGQADINPMLKFAAEKPERGLTLVSITADKSGLSAITHASGPIKTPKDLEGKTLAAPEFDAGRQMFPAFAQAAGIDAKKINWMSVTPELREPMLVQKRADGVTGIVTSTALSLKALGMDWPQQHIMLYRDHGLDLYSTGVITTREFLQKQPDTVRRVLQANFRSMIYAHHHQAEAIQNLKQVEPLTDVIIEAERLATAEKYMTVTDNVRKNGLSSVDPQRLGKQIEAIETAFGFKANLKPEDIYTEAFLPAKAERML